MPSYRYKAASPAGEMIEGATEAASRAAVIEWLHELGHVPLRAEEIGPDGRRPLPRPFLPGRRGLSGKRIGLLTRELAVLLNAGLPLERALTILSGLAPDQAQRALLGRLLDGIRGGLSLADALAREGGAFPRYYVSLVEAGEAGGALEPVLTRLAEHLEKAQAVTETLRSALIYPAILLVMTLLSITAMITLVIPEFEALFEDAGDALPLVTRIVLGAGELLAGYWWLILALAAGACWALRQGLAVPAFRLRWDRLLLAPPLAGALVCKVQTARFARTLGTLVQNGVSLPSALAIVRGSLGNGALAAAVDETASRLREGGGLAEPLARTALFPSLAVQLIRVGEETDQLPAMLTRLADIYDREVQLTVERLVALLVPALTIALGLVIAAVIGSVVLAFLSINDLAL